MLFSRSSDSNAAISLNRETWRQQLHGLRLQAGSGGPKAIPAAAADGEGAAGGVSTMIHVRDGGAEVDAFHLGQESPGPLVACLD